MNCVIASPSAAPTRGPDQPTAVPKKVHGATQRRKFLLAETNPAAQTPSRASGARRARAFPTQKPVEGSSKEARGGLVDDVDIRLPS